MRKCSVVLLFMVLAVGVGLAQQEITNASGPSCPNDTSNPTVANRLVVPGVNGCKAAGTATTGIKGLCGTGCGNSGSAIVYDYGLSYCDTDNAATRGDYIVANGVDGRCHDAGASSVVGAFARVYESNGAPGLTKIWIGADALAVGSTGGSWGTITGDITTQTDLQTALAAKAANSAVVHNTGAETVAGVKTFSSPPSVPTPSASGDATPKTYVDTGLAAKAVDTAVVHNTGAETVAGVKTFSSPPSVPTPVLGTDAVNKTYADSLSGGGLPTGSGNKILATPADGSSGQAALRAAVALDIPALAESKVTNLTTDLAAKAADTAVVHNTGNETVAGTKTFTSQVNGLGFHSTDTVNNGSVDLPLGSSGDSTCPTPAASHDFICYKGSTAQVSKNGAAYTELLDRTQGALDSAVVHNTGAEAVAGVKTFSSSPIVPTPTTSTQAATKGYVDSVAGGTGQAWREIRLGVQQGGTLGNTTGCSIGWDMRGSNYPTGYAFPGDATHGSRCGAQFAVGYAMSNVVGIPDTYVLNTPLTLRVVWLHTVATAGTDTFGYQLVCQDPTSSTAIAQPVYSSEVDASATTVNGTAGRYVFADLVVTPNAGGISACGPNYEMQLRLLYHATTVTTDTGCPTGATSCPVVMAVLWKDQ